MIDRDRSGRRGIGPTLWVLATMAMFPLSRWCPADEAAQPGGATGLKSIQLANELRQKFEADHPATQPAPSTEPPSTQPAIPVDPRSDNLNDLMLGFARGHEFKEARRLVPLIDTDARLAAYRTLAMLQTRSGDLNGATDWIDALDDPMSRVYSLVGIADALLPESTLEIALGLLFDEEGAIVHPDYPN